MSMKTISRPMAGLLFLASLCLAACSAPPAPTLVNQEPVADAGPDQQVALGERVRLDASASTDADGDPLQYIWEAGQQNPSPVDLPSLASFEFSPAVAGTYTFVLKVDDSQALSAPDTVAVVVGGRRNTAPVAIAGPDQIVPFATRTVLDGSFSSDADGDSLLFFWRLTQGPEELVDTAIDLSDTTAASLAFVPPISGEYRFELVVDDGTAQSSDEISVFVQSAQANQAPLADAGPDQQVAVGQTVVLDGSASTDPEGDPLRFAWSVGNTPGIGVVLADSTSSTQTFVATAAGEYVFALVVNDGQTNSIRSLVRIEASPTALERDGMVQVAAGAFDMGSDLGADDEKPVHRVEISAFWIDKTEVTAAAYAACVESGACSQPPAAPGCNSALPDRVDHPVNCVTWEQAQTYCLWAGKRLPTEAEWEKAARGTDGRRFAWGNALPDRERLNFNDNLGGTAETGTYESGASFYGLLNMGGNVSEWTADRYDAAYYSQSPSVDPQGPESGDFRTVRGGNWQIGVPIAVLSATIRGRFVPTTAAPTLGFRCAANDGP